MTRTKIMTGGALLALSFTLACSGGGITAPTGTSTSASTTIVGSTGTVSAAQTARLSATPASSVASASIEICVHGTTTCSPLDASGRFQLEGDFTGDVQLDIMDGDRLVAGLIIPGVVLGETIVIRVEIEEERSRIEILSRSSGDDQPGDDDSSGDELDDDSTDETSHDHESEGDDVPDTPTAPVSIAP